MIIIADESATDAISERAVESDAAEGLPSLPRLLSTSVEIRDADRLPFLTLGGLRLATQTEPSHVAR